MKIPLIIGIFLFLIYNFVFFDDYSEGRNLSHILAINNLCSAIKVLGYLNYDLDAKDSEGQTPLIFATTQKHACAVNILLLNGASKCKKNNYGKSSDELANESGYIPIIKIMRNYRCKSYVHAAKSIRNLQPNAKPEK